MKFISLRKSLSLLKKKKTNMAQNIQGTYALNLFFN